MTKFIYISNNAVNRLGRESPFLQQEKEWLSMKFGPFKIICDTGVYECDYNANIRQCNKKKAIDCIRSALFAISDRNVYKEIIHIIKDHKTTFKNIIKLFVYSYNSHFIYRWTKPYVDNNVILYSYWFSYDSYACARIKNKNPNIFFISRAHAYEIQINRNSCNPYLMKSYVCNNSDIIAFISKDALRSFSHYYTLPFKNGMVKYLGSTQKGSGYIAREQNDIITILSCSSMLPIKRLDRLVLVLARINKDRIHWIHIGDGPEKNTIQQMAKDTLDPNPYVTYEFVGYQKNDKVYSYLQRKDIDLFINVSDSEGVPVSIMEAMSVGLPVIAPRIFGIPELVDENCGFLFDLKDPENSIIECLNLFSRMQISERIQMGENAYKKWKTQFCLEHNLTDLFSAIPFNIE